MRILVIGAHHGLGAQVVRRARALGHEVTVFEGDVLDPGAVAQAVAGQDAVVSTLGPGKASPADLCAQGTAHIVAAMQGAGVRRLALVSGALIGHPQARLGWLYRFIRSRLPAAMLADRRAAERGVRESGLDWTLIRPTRLTDAAPRGQWRDGETERVGALAQIARGDVAEAILRALAGEAAIGQAWTLQY